MSQNELPNSPADAEPAVGKGTQRGAAVVAAIIAISLALYFIGDRLTPYTSQARVQAFVVPVAAEVSGKVRKVLVANNDEVKPGQTLFEIDPTQYEIALQRAQSDLESVRQSVDANAANVDVARAALAAAEASADMARRDANRQEKLYEEDSGAISVRRLETAQTTREEARAKARRAEADLRKAITAAGAAGEDNSQWLSAKSAVEKAELDLSRTKIVAPASGRVTDLRIDTGHFAQAGAPVLTLIAMHDLWISADMTENNLGNIDVGDEAEIVLDVLPGDVFKGRVRSIGWGVSSGQQSAPGSLPTVQSSRDWLRPAQRIPVVIEIDAAEMPQLKGVRIGGQADVLVYTDKHFVMNLLGALYIRVMSLLSYLY